MAESKVLQIDFGDTLKQIVAIKEETAKLAAENERLKKSTADNTQAAEENSKAIALNESKIRTLNKEKQTLTKTVDNEIKLQKAAKGSIEANRLELSRLTAEYIKLAKPTEEQTKRIKTLSDRLKEQEAVIGNDTRKVGGYQEAIEKAAKNVNIFGINVGETIGNLKEKQKALSAVTTGIGGTTKGLQIMRAALISTGIGAIVVALGLLVNAFLSTQKGMDSLNKVLLPAKRVLVEIGEVLEDIAVKGFDRLTEAIANPKQALIDLGVIIQENLLNRIKAFAVAGDGLMKLATGNWKEGFKSLGNSVIQLNTGIVDGIGKLEAFGAVASKVIDQAVIDGEKIFALQKKISITERDLALSREEQLSQLADLKLAAADQTKSEEERLKILTKADALRRKIGEEDKELARQRVQLFELENAGDMDLIETQTELNKLKAEEKKINREVSEDLKRITSQRTGIIQDAQEKAAEDLAKLNTDNLKKQLQTDKQYFDTKQTLAKEALARNEIDQEEYDKRILDLQAQSFASQIEILGAFHQDVTDTDNALKNLLLDNQIKFNQAKANADEDAAEKAAEDAKERAEEEIQLLQTIADLRAEIIGSAINAVSEISRQAGENRLQELEEQEQAELELAERTGADKDAIEKKFAAKRNEIVVRQFNIDKVTRIAEAIMATAQAAINAFNSLVGIPIAGPGLAAGAAAAAAAFGAIQVGIISAQKPPKLAEGGEVNVGGKPHTQGGTTYVGEDGNVFEVEKGEKIYVMKRTASQAIDYYSKINQMFGGKAWKGGSTNFAALGGEIGTGKKYVNMAFAPQFDGGFAAREAAANVNTNVRNIPAPVLHITELHRVENAAQQSVNVSEL